MTLRKARMEPTRKTGKPERRGVREGDTEEENTLGREQVIR